MKSIFNNKRVFLTGHTGFKGSWLLQILNHWGADVKGYALPPEAPDDLFNQIKGAQLCYAHVLADIRDLKTLTGEMVRFEPHFVFHLAAQPLVRRSYREPVTTFETNLMGTVHVLEAMRQLSTPAVGVMITTDKVYENPERGVAFSEDDKLGGYDPYAASKAACEIAIDSYRNSYFNTHQNTESYKSIAAARAGNVIGGGDYSEDRLVPDIIRSIQRLEPVELRNPNSTRPWQHVLEPLSGYLQLAAKMYEQPHDFNRAYNFGPDEQDTKTVVQLTEMLLSRFPQNQGYFINSPADAPHEANLLMLNSYRAAETLQWKPKLNSTQAIEWTGDWYANKAQDAATKCLEQIERYFSSKTSE